MTVTNTSEGGSGIRMRNGTVELFDVALKGYNDCGLFLSNPTSKNTVVATSCEFSNSNIGAFVSGSLSSATFNNCIFHDNKLRGLIARESTIHLHGEATAIHSNKIMGIRAIDSAKVFIHLPSHHNTFYNNKEEDRQAIYGGTITNVVD